MRLRTILAATAAVVTVAGLGVAGATPASAIPLQEVTSFGPGSVPPSLVVAWTADNSDVSVYIGIAKAAAFNPADPCSHTDWNTASGDPANLVGYFYQGAVSNPHEFTSYTDWNDVAVQFAVEPSTEYVACYFDEFNAGSGSPVFATTSGVTAASGARPIWYLALGRASAEATCPNNYTSSWAQWPNAGRGGWVCNREVFADEPLS